MHQDTQTAEQVTHRVHCTELKLHSYTIVSVGLADDDDDDEQMDQREQSGGGQDGMQLKLGFFFSLSWVWSQFLLLYFQFWREHGTDDMKAKESRAATNDYFHYCLLFWLFLWLTD